MTERERAEQLLENLRSIVELHSGDTEEMIGVTLAFAREERARVWREALNKVAQDFHDSYGALGCPIGCQEVQAFLDSRHVHYPECQAKALREEGGQ